MQKALTQMNIRLTEAISDIMGFSGSRIITAILEGERNPEILVQYCHSTIMKTKKELVTDVTQRIFYFPTNLLKLLTLLCWQQL